MSQALKNLRIFFFGLNTKDKAEMTKLVREADKSVSELYRKRNEIASRPIPNCDGTFGG